MQPIKPEKKYLTRDELAEGGHRAGTRHQDLGGGFVKTPGTHENEGYLTKEDLGARLKLCPRTITRWMKTGRIPFRRLGPNSVRFKWSEVEQALEEYERRMNAKQWPANGER